MRAQWLEPHDQYEGVGAHELNRRYDWCDEGDHDQEIVAVPDTMPALFAARSSLVAGAPIRFDGADISHHQYDAGAVNLEGLAASSWWLAFKLTQSTSYKDPTAARTRAGAEGAGFTHRGLYHWISSTTDPERGAAWFLSCLGGLRPGEFAMLDAEEAGITADRCLAWLEAVEAATQRPAAVYTGAYVAGGSIWRSGAIREGRYGPRPMILAAYVSEVKARGLPGISTNPWHSWQYSSNGPVQGITGRCDMNRVDDRDIYDRACGITTPQGHTEQLASLPPLPEPAPPDLDQLIALGGGMYSIIGNADAAPGTPEGNKRWAWNGLVKVYLSERKYLDFLHGGLLVPGHEDLARALMMDSATLAQYATIEIGP